MRQAPLASAAGGQCKGKRGGFFAPAFTPPLPVALRFAPGYPYEVWVAGAQPLIKGRRKMPTTEAYLFIVPSQGLITRSLSRPFFRGLPTLPRQAGALRS